LRLAGWRFDGALPAEKKYVCIAVPHTSNWDGLMLVMLAQSVGLELSWMIKQSHVKGPAGALMTRFGAVSVDRERTLGVVEEMVDLFRTRDSFVLAIAPEGTRGRADYWKSGFYHIALGAHVPVVPAFLDYARKCGGVGAPLHMTGDVHDDMDRIRRFYQAGGYTARFPSSVGPIRLREEDA